VQDGGQDAARLPDSTLDAAPTGDAGRPGDAALDAALVKDAAVLLDAELGSSSCAYPGDISDASCAPSGLICSRKFRCYTATDVGPVGTDRCECVGERWSCTDSCAVWQSQRDASR
jgi:hypothetical protein